MSWSLTLPVVHFPAARSNGMKNVLSGSGAFATLLAADLTLPVSPTSRSPDHDEGYWYAVSIGDTCMFQIRDDNLIGAFPAIPSSEFGNNPALVGSNHSDREFLRAHTLVHSGSVVQGDDFFMCTDALALWFTEQVEHGCKPWTVLRDLQAIGFAEWLDYARRTGDLRNDDVTLPLSRRSSLRLFCLFVPSSLSFMLMSGDSS